MLYVDWSSSRVRDEFELWIEIDSWLIDDDLMIDEFMIYVIYMFPYNWRAYKSQFSVLKSELRKSLQFGISGWKIIYSPDWAQGYHCFILMRIMIWLVHMFIEDVTSWICLKWCVANCYDYMMNMRIMIILIYVLHAVMIWYKNECIMNIMIIGCGGIYIFEMPWSGLNRGWKRHVKSFQTIKKIFSG